MIFERHRFGIPTLLVLLTVVIYAQTLFFGYVNLDDEELIVQRQGFLRKAENIPAMFTHDVSFPNRPAPYYRPLLTLTFMLDVSKQGGNTALGHLMNIMLHVGVVLMLWVLFMEMGIDRMKALFFSALFAVHPALVQAVAWIPGRNDSLVAFWVLVSCIFFLKSLRSKSWMTFGAHMLFFAFALLTKEIAIVMPVIFAGLWLLFSGIPFSWRRFLVYALLWASSVFLWFSVRSHALSTIPSESLSELLTQIWGSLPMIIVYIGKVFFPFQLSVMPSAQDSSLWYGIGAILLFGFILFWYRRQIDFQRICFGLFWFIILSIPSLISYDDASRIAFFEHRLYLPIIGIFLCLALLPWKVRKAWGIVLLVFTVLTVSHARAFREPISFWGQATHSSPSLARAHNSLGMAYAAARRLDEAFIEFQTAYGMNPEDYLVNVSLGEAYRLRHEPERAEEYLKRAVAINFERAQAHHSLGFLYATQGRMQEAEQEWKIAIRFNPIYALSHEALAVYYAQIHRYDEAILHIQHLMDIGSPVLPELQKIYTMHHQVL